MKAVFRHELSSHLQSVTGYVFGAFLLLFAGIYTMVINLKVGYANFEYAISSMSFIYIIGIPILTMRTLAEERKQTTDQLLYSLPLTMAKVVLGKYLVLLIMLAMPVAIIAVYPLILSAFGSVYLPAAYSALLGFYMLGAALSAMGVFISSLMENQASAAGLCFAIMLLNYFVASLAGYVSTTALASFIAFAVLLVVLAVVVRLLTKNTFAALMSALVPGIVLVLLYGLMGSGFEGVFPAVMEQLSLFDRFYQFTDGLMDIRALIYFASVIMVFLFLSVQSMGETEVERMKKFNLKGMFAKTTASLKTSTVRIGGYSIFAVLIVIAIAVAANYFAAVLPDSAMEIDVTSNQLFTTSDQTEKVVSTLEDDVTIYWVVRADYEDPYIETMLGVYEGLSDNLTVEKIDPDVHPTLISQYTDTVEENSLIIVSGEQSTFVSYYDIYVYDYSSYYYDYTYDVTFEFENAVTSAIAYVTSDDLPIIYVLEGHGESELSDTFTAAIEDENIVLSTLSLLTLEAVPEDADCVLIFAPTSDISEDEKDKLLAYLQSGGTMLLITDPPEGDMSNLYALMAEYGAEAVEGILMEGDSNYYAWGTQHYLLPDLNSHDITDPLIDGRYYVLLPIAQGLLVSDTIPDGVTVEELLTTSSDAYSKVAGYDIETYDKEDGDIDGPFALGLAITATLDDDAETKIVWYSSAALLDDSTNSQVSDGNLNLFINSIGWMCEQENSISIRAKSLDTEYLTIGSGTVSLLSVLIVGLIPLGYLSIGIISAIRRKRK